MPHNLAKIDQAVSDLKIKFADRDFEMERVKLVRAGNIHYLAPDLFSSDLPRAVVANTIDVVARDLVDVMSPLPNLDCAVGQGVSQADKRRGEKKNRIGGHYWHVSKLGREMRRFADHYNSYGVAAFQVEADFERATPVIRVEDPCGLYYRKDRWGNVVEYAKCWFAQAGDIAALYPEHASVIMARGDGHGMRSPTDLIEMVKYVDPAGATVYIRGSSTLVAARQDACLKRIPLVIVEREGLDDVPRGQFADSIWVQLAKAVMAQYTLNAAEKSINAPTLLPKDVSNFAIGPDAVMLTDAAPQGFGRMRLDVPGEVFAMSKELQDELNEGSRYPDARSGGAKGSVITGRGVEALMGAFDSQLKAAQDLFKIALEDATSMCFELDVKLFGSTKKTITGVQTGRPFELTYTPATDIAENYGCECTYGFAAGMTPAQSMVGILQLRGDKLIGRDTARAQLPFSIDGDKEQRDLDTQDLNDALMQGLAAATQAMGPMIQQGMPVDKFLTQIAKVHDLRVKGKALHEAVLEAFEPEPPPPTADPGAPGGGGPGLPGEMPAEPGPGGGPLPGMQVNGRLQGVAAGQAGMPPGGMPAIQSLISGLRGANGEARMSAETLRKRPLGLG